MTQTIYCFAKPTLPFVFLYSVDQFIACCVPCNDVNWSTFDEYPVLLNLLQLLNIISRIEVEPKKLSIAKFSEYRKQNWKLRKKNRWKELIWGQSDDLFDQSITRNYWMQKHYPHSVIHPLKIEGGSKYVRRRYVNGTVCATKDVQANFVNAKVVPEQTYFSKKKSHLSTRQPSNMPHFALKPLFRKLTFFVM